MGCICKLCSSAFTLAMFATVALLLWHFLGRPETIDEAMDGAGDLIASGAEVLSDFSWDDFDFGEMFSNESEENGSQEGQELSWDLKKNVFENGAGLSLQIENNLDDTWQDEFDEAVKNWVDSDPRILNLETVRGQEGSCAPREGGVMVVCNGNNGDDGMLGFNSLMFDGSGTIITSVAQMNEYYLQNADWPERLYTMCHEVGHGFGLDHTDEDPYNTDTGECMDYTDSPENNMFPGPANFVRLAEKYGAVSRRSLGTGPGLGDDISRQKPPRQSKLAPNLLQSYEEAVSAIRVDAAASADSRGRRRRGLLKGQQHQARGGRKFTRSLIDGYSVEVHVLYPRRHA